MSGNQRSPANPSARGYGTPSPTYSGPHSQTSSATPSFSFSGASPSVDRGRPSTNQGPQAGLGSNQPQVRSQPQTFASPTGSGIGSALAAGLGVTNTPPPQAPTPTFNFNGAGFNDFRDPPADPNYMRVSQVPTVPLNSGLPQTYSGPKGTTELNHGARFAQANLQGFHPDPVTRVPGDAEMMGRMALAESRGIHNPAGGINTDALQGTMDVMRNRALSPRFDTPTVPQVLKAPKQFSPMSDGSFAATPADPAATKLAEGVLSGEVPSVVGNALNYANTDYLKTPAGIADSSKATRKAFANMVSTASFADAKNPGVMHSFGTTGAASDVALNGTQKPLVTKPSIVVASNAPRKSKASKAPTSQPNLLTKYGLTQPVANDAAETQVAQTQLPPPPGYLYSNSATQVAQAPGYLQSQTASMDPRPPPGYANSQTAQATLPPPGYLNSNSAVVQLAQNEPNVQQVAAQSPTFIQRLLKDVGVGGKAGGKATDTLLAMMQPSHGNPSSFAGPDPVALKATTASKTPMTIAEVLAALSTGKDPYKGGAVAYT